MLHYKYIHGGAGFTAKLSENNYLGKALFETARGAVEGDSFSYFNVDGRQGLFLQYTPADKRMPNGKAAPYDFAEGFLCSFEEVENAPAKYAGKFKTEAVSADEAGDLIDNAPLPRADASYPDISSVSSVSKIVDALLFGQKDKPVVILTRDIRQATQYLKIIEELLPDEYVKRLGFSLGSSRIPKNLSLIDTSGKKVNLDARLILPCIDPDRFNALTNVHYVFDAVGKRDNYDGKASELSLAIDSLDLGRDYLVSDFKNGISRAFGADGSVNVKLIDRVAVIMQFENAKAISSIDTALARKVLALDVATDDIELTNTAVEAIECVLQAHDISDGDLIAINRWRDVNGDVKNRTQAIYLDYLTANFRKIDDARKNDIIKTVFDDPSGSRFDLLIEDSEGDVQFAKDVFSRIMNSLRSRREEFRISQNAALLDKMIGFFDFKNWHAARDSGAFKDFFELLTVTQATNNLDVGCMLLMGSCYLSPKGSFKQGRIEKFKKFTEWAFNIKEGDYKIKTSSKSSEEQRKKQAAADEKITKVIDFILSVRNCMVTLKNCRVQGGKYVEDGGLSAFLIDEFVGKKWINSMIGCLSVEALIKLALDISSTDENYSEMINLVRARLLDGDYVGENVNSVNIENYEVFWNALSETEKMGAEDVKKHLDKLGNETRISNRFLQYRTDFVKGFFDTMSDEAQSKLIKDGSSDEAFEEEDTGKRLRLIEGSIERFGTCAGKVKKGRAPTFSSIAVWAAVYTIVSILLLFLPAFVMCASLNTFSFAVFVEKLKYYMHPLFTLVPLYVFLLDIAVYAALKNDKTVKRVHRANKVTFLCGILPVIAFALGYILLWFLPLQIPFLTI